MRKRLEVAHVIRNVQITQRLWWCEYKAPEIASSALPGQFAHVLCSEPEQLDPLLRRPLSFSRIDPSKGRVAFLLNTVGQGTSWLVQQPAGSEIDMLGPLGTPFELLSAKSNVLLVGGGIGLAPLIALADTAPQHGINVRLLGGGRDVEQITPKEWLHPDTTYLISTDDGTAGHHGFVTDLVPEHYNWSDQICVCGPTPMMQAMAQLSPRLARKHGNVPVHTSLEARMGCAMGVCYSCVVKTTEGVKRACHDGPVFDQNLLTWEWAHVAPVHGQQN